MDREAIVQLLMSLMPELDPNRMDDMQAAANWGDAYSARDYSNPTIRDMTGGADHRAFTRNFIHEHPILGAPAMTAAIPAYNLAKKTGILQGGQKPGLFSMGEAYRGMLEGLKDVYAAR